MIRMLILNDERPPLAASQIRSCVCESEVATNKEIEMRWIDAWNDLYDIARGLESMQCQLPDGSVVGVEECKGWLQQSAYRGYALEVSTGNVNGRPGAIVSRKQASLR